jgi:xanthosine utilization system XapX-like protein
MVSAIVVVVSATVSVRGTPVTPMPELTVVRVCAAPNPLSPLNVKPPTPPLEILVRVIVGRFVFVNVQEMLEPAAVAAAFSTSAPVARFGVAVPPAAMPEQVAEVSA